MSGKGRESRWGEAALGISESAETGKWEGEWRWRLETFRNMAMRLVQTRVQGLHGGAGQGCTMNLGIEATARWNLAPPILPTVWMGSGCRPWMLVSSWNSTNHIFLTVVACSWHSVPGDLVNGSCFENLLSYTISSIISSLRDPGEASSLVMSDNVLNPTVMSWGTGTHPELRSMAAQRRGRLDEPHCYHGCCLLIETGRKQELRRRCQADICSRSHFCGGGGGGKQDHFHYTEFRTSGYSVHKRL